MSERFLVLQHLDVEHPGIFRDFMRADRISWDTVELDAGDAIPDLAPYAALIVMGGPMDVWEERTHPWLAQEKTVIARSVVHDRRPFLGVCLGHQLLASALGGDVARAAAAEVGVMPVELNEAGRRHAFFNGAPARFECLQWHAAEVTRAPTEAVVLATSERCAVQALAIREHAFSFQFHVEVIASTVDDWNAIPAYQRSCRDSLGADGAKVFRTAVAHHMAAFNRLARTLYDNWRQIAFDRQA